MELIYLNWQGATSKFQLRDYEIEMLDSIRNELVENDKNKEVLEIIKDNLFNSYEWEALIQNWLDRKVISEEQYDSLKEVLL